MSYSTYNGVNIIPMPTTPGFRDFSLYANDSVGMTKSPFSQTQQVQYWVGADFWEADVTLPPMTDAQTGPWRAWLASLRGMANVFQMGDPMRLAPVGSFPTGPPPLINGAISPGQFVMSIRALPPSTTGVFQPGDYLQIAYRLHMIAGVTSINSDSSGTASIEIWPSVRDSQADGGQIGVINTQGLWRLADNKRNWSIDAHSQLWTLSFKAVEAR